MEKTGTRAHLLFMVKAAVIAALYTALTLAFAPIAYRDLQVRVSEALTILPLFTPAAIPGLFVGCLLSNGIGIVIGANTLGVLDLVVGTSATLLAALCTYFLRNVTTFKIPVLAFLPPVVFNAVMVGWELSYVFQSPFLINAMWVAFGEVIAVCGLGGVLYTAIRKTKVSRLLSAA